MGTCNFYNQSKFDLWVISEPDDIDEQEFFCDDVKENFKYEIEPYNDELMFHKLELKSGYYSGAQVFVKELQGVNPHELDNEDCRYYFDLCKSQAIRKYEAELKRINKKILPNAESIGFFEINCLGVFSNGEAIYEVAKK